MPDWTPLPKSTDEEIEAKRQKDLAEAIAERNDEFPDIASLVEHFKPGTFGAHEALHTASIVMDLHERHVQSHPTVLGDPEAYRLASRAGEYLFDLYQYLGAFHLGRTDEASSSTTVAKIAKRMAGKAT